MACIFINQFPCALISIAIEQKTIKFFLFSSKEFMEIQKVLGPKKRLKIKKHIVLFNLGRKRNRQLV